MFSKVIQHIQYVIFSKHMQCLYWIHDSKHPITYTMFLCFKIYTILLHFISIIKTSIYKQTPTNKSGYFSRTSNLRSQVASSTQWCFHNTLTKGIVLPCKTWSGVSKTLTSLSSYETSSSTSKSVQSNRCAGSSSYFWSMLIWNTLWTLKNCGGNAKR